MYEVPATQRAARQVAGWPEDAGLALSAKTFWSREGGRCNRMKANSEQ